MMEEILTKIMWLEENPFIVDKYIDKAKDFDLELVPFNCWEDAKNALISNVKGWRAIILNPQCKLGRGDRPKPQKFLPQVFCDIATISTKYDTIIPWYVFSDLNPSLIEDLIVKDREIYDAEWERPYYNMAEDSDHLFHRIKMQTSSMERTKIREGVHKGMFDKLSILTSFGFSIDDINTMEDILISLYENKESSRCNFVNVRKIIESLLKSMLHFNILPDDLLNASGEVNTTACVRLLAGMRCTNNGYEYKTQDCVIDKIAGTNLYNILNICHGYAHSNSTLGSRNRLETNEYLDSVKTNNLLHSCTLMLADIIIMYCNSIITIRDVNNMIFWTKAKYE
ncbi:MAG: hypothetical protein MJZ27_01130 [Bacteroidales bacterium]|nr:hypothetical protein [Bacteroidales bacterium]